MGQYPPASVIAGFADPPTSVIHEAPDPPASVRLTVQWGSVRDDEIRRILTEANPWWRAAAAGHDPVDAVRSHRLIRDRARHDLGYRPSVLKDLATGPVGDSLVVLTGPRRVGKSVALLDLAAELCGRRDIQPFQVIHVPCDGMAPGPPSAPDDLQGLRHRHSPRAPATRSRPPRRPAKARMSPRPWTDCASMWTATTWPGRTTSAAAGSPVPSPSIPGTGRSASTTSATWPPSSAAT